ncbi:TniQ family protein [Oerskovia turbata]
MERETGESLQSWLLRAGHRYGIHPRAMLSQLGLATTPQVNVDPRRLLSGQAGVIAAARIGVDADALTAIDPLTASLAGTRARFRHEFLGLKQVVRTKGSRWCTRCLEGTGVWQESWRDPLHLYCARHRLVLESRCYWCSAVPFESSAWLTSLEEPDDCPEFVDDRYTDGSRYRGRCRHPFRHPDPTPAEDSDLECQRILIDFAERAHHTPTRLVRACGIEAQALPVFEAALEIIGTICPTFATTQPFDNDESLRYAARVAVNILIAPSPESALRIARRHRAFGTDDHKIPILGPRGEVRGAPRNPLLVAVWLSDMHGRVSLPYELRFRMGSPRPRYPDGWQDHGRALQEMDRRPGLPLSALPQVAWNRLQLLPHAEELGLDSRTGRTFISLCLARYGTTRSFSVLATALGLPAWSAGLYEKHWRTIHTSGRWREYLQGLDHLFHLLHEAPPPIDYQQRRSDAWSPQHLRPVAERLLPYVRDTTDKRATLGALTLALWGLYTGGDVTIAPPDYRPGRDGQTAKALTLNTRTVSAAWPHDLVPP